MSSNLLSFHEIDSLPHNIKILHLDDGSGLETSFKKNSASWHDSCRIKFNKTELVRARKRIENENGESEENSKYLRGKKSGSSKPKNIVCFFCEKSEHHDSLRTVKTLTLDRKIRNIAIDVGDEHLICKLSTADMIAQNAKYHAKCLVGLYARCLRGLLFRMQFP